MADPYSRKSTSVSPLTVTPPNRDLPASASEPCQKETWEGISGEELNAAIEAAVSMNRTMGRVFENSPPQQWDMEQSSTSNSPELSRSQSLPPPPPPPSSSEDEAGNSKNPKSRKRRHMNTKSPTPGPNKRVRRRLTGGTSESPRKGGGTTEQRIVLRPPVFKLPPRCLVKKPMNKSPASAFARLAKGGLMEADQLDAIMADAAHLENSGPVRTVNDGHHQLSQSLARRDTDDVFAIEGSGNLFKRLTLNDQHHPGQRLHQQDSTPMPEAGGTRDRMEFD